MGAIILQGTQVLEPSSINWGRRAGVEGGGVTGARLSRGVSTCLGAACGLAGARVGDGGFTDWGGDFGLCCGAASSRAGEGDAARGATGAGADAEPCVGNGLAAVSTGAMVGVCEALVGGEVATSRGVAGGGAVFAPFRLPARIAATAMTRTTTIRTFPVLRMSRFSPDNEIRPKRGLAPGRQRRRYRSGAREVRYASTSAAA